MRIHTDVLGTADLRRTLPEGVLLSSDLKGSRKRAHAFEVSLSTEGGTDRHGQKRRYAAGHSEAVGSRTATYTEWGDWMVELFKIDPDAIVGIYDGEADFIHQTSEVAERRDRAYPDERATEHAARWIDELESGVFA